MILGMVGILDNTYKMATSGFFLKVSTSEAPNGTGLLLML